MRLRQLLGTRFDYRRAEAEWAWHMRLVYRIPQLNTPGKASEGTEEQENIFLSTCWGHEFLSWREDGRALVLGAEASTTIANTSLASGTHSFLKFLLLLLYHFFHPHFRLHPSFIINVFFLQSFYFLTNCTLAMLESRVLILRLSKMLQHNIL